MVRCRQVKANVLPRPVPPKAPLHSHLARDTVGALVRPCHVTPWPQTALEALEMDHTVLFSLKYLWQSGHRLQVLCAFPIISL